MVDKHGSIEPGTHIERTDRAQVLYCIIVTPEATVREASASFVALPLFDGEIGVAPGHTPFIGRLGYGELRIVDGGRTERVDNVVSVLTQRAVPAEQLSTATAAEQLAAARTRKANTPELLEIRDRLTAQARAQLRIAEKNV